MSANGEFIKFIVDGVEYTASIAEALIMPAGRPHSVHAKETFKIF